MNTDKVIERLVADATPVRPLTRARVRLGRWLAVAVAAAAGGVWAVGARFDLTEALRQPMFLVITTLLGAAAILSAAHALVLSIPGAERSPLQRALPIAAILAWPSLLLLGIDQRLVADELLAFRLHGACGPLIAGLAGLPAWVLYRMVREGVTLHPAWGGALASLAAAASAGTAMQIICPIDAPPHHLVEHVLPVVVLCAVGALIGRRWLAPAQTAGLP